jgi:hypothetical protein
VRLLRSATPVLAVLTAAGCIQYVSPSRTLADYESKAVNTAEAVLSAVATAALTVQVVDDDRTIGPTVAVLLSEAESDAGAAASTFDGVQPPSEEAEEVFEELEPLLDDATSRLRDLRVAARRNGADDVVAAGADLARLAADLEAFIEARG